MRMTGCLTALGVMDDITGTVTSGVPITATAAGFLDTPSLVNAGTHGSDSWRAIRGNDWYVCSYGSGTSSASTPARARGYRGVSADAAGDQRP
jgi:hypothetical protein